MQDKIEDSRFRLDLEEDEVFSIFDTHEIVEPIR